VNSRLAFTTTLSIATSPRCGLRAYFPTRTTTGEGACRHATLGGALEVLHRALVLFRGGACLEGAQVAALAGVLILLARVEAVLTGFEFADHGRLDDKFDS